jgi:pimeloyl-ACP methyl ester carboxylesterase
MLFNAAWFDGSDLEPHLRQLPYRCVTPTLLGFEQRARRRFELSLNDHIVLLAGLLRAKIEEVRPSRVLLAGFSSAGDLVLHMAAQSHEGVPPPDGVLVLGGNQAMETCFGSRVLARLDANHPAQLMQDLRSVLDVATNLDEWIIVNGYLSRIMVNFRSDLRPLRSLARAIVEPFEKDDRGAFAKMYREASARARLVRCVFEDSEVCNRLLKATLLDHMDRGVLGDRYRDGSLIIEPTNSHFELIQPERVAKHLAEMVQELSEMESQSAP